MTRADLWVVGLVILVLGWYGLSVHRLGLSTGSGVALDDGWIHLTFARNLAERGIWSVNPTGQTGGASSILWVLMLAPGFWMTSNGPMISYILNGVFLILLAMLVVRFWGEFVSNTWVKVVLTFLTVANGHMVWFVFSGMEVLPALVLGLGTIYLASRKRPGLAMVLSLLSGLVRPEGFLVGLAVFLWSRDRAGLKVLFAGMAGLGLTLWWNHHVTGTLLPSTVMGRRWLMDAPAQADLNPWHVVRNFFRLVGVWGYRFLQFDLNKQLLDGLGWGGVLGLFSLFGVFYSVVGFVFYLFRMTALAGGLLVWAVLQLGAYAVILPTRGHAGRYQPAVLMVLLVCLCLGMLVVWSRSKGRVHLRAALMIFVLVPLSLLYTWNRIMSESLVHFDGVHVSAAKWVAQNVPRESKVAGFDIGALGYFGDRTIVDLGGLIDPAAGRALYDGKISQYMRSSGAEYLVMVFPYTSPDVYFQNFGFDRLSRDGVLQLRKEFSVKVTEPYWPGEAARVMANTIRIYGIQWKAEK